MSTETLERPTADAALVVPPAVADALKYFIDEDANGATPLLAMVRGKIDTFKAEGHTVDTAAGRDAIRSFANKVTKSKTALEEVGKALADEQKSIPKRIDATRRRIKETLDKWRDEVRQPLTDFEEAEEARLNAITGKLEELKRVVADNVERTSEILRDWLEAINRDFVDVSEAAFDEYAGAAAELKAAAVASLEARIAVTEKRETEARELAELRAKNAENERRERERQIADEAAAKAKADAAEAVARAEREKQAAIEREEEAKRNAERRAVEAAQAAKEQAEREARKRQEAEAAAQKAREQDRERRVIVHRAALEALTQNDISDEVARKVITLIAQGQVPHITVNY